MSTAAAADERLETLARTRADVEAATREVGRKIFARLAKGEPSIFERRWWDDRIMAWAMQDESVKVQMFRFIDVLPMLDTSAAVTGHLHEYFHDVKRCLPAAARLGLAVARPDSIAGRALALAARRNAMGHARRFIAGTNTTEVLAAAKRERKLGRAFTLDILGEAVASEVEADRYLQAYLDLVHGVAPVVNDWPEDPRIDRDQFGALPRTNVSVKLSALDSQFDPIDPVGTTARVGARLRTLLRTARERQAYVHVDMESYATKNLTLAIFESVLLEDEFRDTRDVGIVIQCYLRDALADLARLREWAERRGTPVWVRLVKGAYWDYETVHAEALGWPVPVFQEKWRSDECFERATEFVMANYEWLRPAIASHNVRSLAHAIAVARQLDLPDRAFELQMLYGMGDVEKQAFVDLGYRLRTYMPYGELIPGMAYLVRRLLENTSNDSFLRASFTERVSPETLLMSPEEVARQNGRRLASAPAPAAPKPFEPSFRNEPWLDFALAENRQRMQQALDRVKSRLGAYYPLVIGGRAIETAARIESFDPSHKSRLVGVVAAATAADATRAVEAARAAWPQWRAAPVAQRARVLGEVAQRMREARTELAAWQIYECGKTWREADADVAEAIDFCEFYAAEAVRLQSADGVDVPGEENRFYYHPRGVAVVIAPWNFPLAILTGMTVAALAAGNTVVMKPAEQSSIVAAGLMNILRDAGVPDGVVNFLPGRGEEVGPALVEHPQTSLIAFTGSRAVGLDIQRRAAATSGTGAPHIKRVIAELGGKNAIVVDDDADLDEAVIGVVKSAFGFQGQKCSACSRAIVLDRVYATFLDRLVEATRSLKVGPAEAPGTSVGPVIDGESFDRVHKYIAIGREEGREVLAVEPGELAEQGWFVGPHIFADVAPTARIAQEEIFGPVLAVLRARDFDHAIELVNGTDYALTAGCFSRSPAHLERARREIMVGNLYLNRGCTGALVCRQPFGGFKMSGIGSKAGGQDYLLQFVVPRTVTENTMRRGFAPTAAREQD